MPPPHPDTNRTVLVNGTKEVSDMAAAAAVVDAAVSSTPVDMMVHTTEQNDDEAAAVAATLVADPTAGAYKDADPERVEHI